MKNKIIFNEKIRVLVMILPLALFFPDLGFSQKTYDKAKLITNNGHILQGRQARVSDESVTFRYNGQRNEYSFDELSQVSVKRGRARRWGLGFGGVCFAVMGFTLFDDPQANINHPNSLFFPYLAGTLTLTALSAGFGYLLGTVADPWQEIYHRSQSATMHRIQPILNFDYKGRPLLGVSYSF